MTTININLPAPVDHAANAVREALALARAQGGKLDTRLEAEMHALLKERPSLASKPHKLLAGAEVRIGIRDGRSWSKVIGSMPR